MNDPVREKISVVAPKSYADNLSPDGAAELARRIDAFWHGHGYTAARHWVEKGFISGGGIISVVRGNLVNGIPPRDRP